MIRIVAAQLWFVVVLGGLDVVFGCAPNTSQNTTPPMVMAPPEAVEPEQSTSEYGLNVRRLERDCTRGDARGCAVLGAALEAYDANVEGSRVDLPAALRYLVRACDLGELSGCDRAGDILAKGQGVEKDLERAVTYYAKACNASTGLDPLQGFACWGLGNALLDEKGQFFENYGRAMSAFESACAMQPSTCSSRDFYKGTGLVSASEPPSGAVGFAFGTSSSAVKATCIAKGGTVSSSSGGDLSCDQLHIDALNETAEFVLLKFCGDALCGMLIALRPGQDRYVARYIELKKQLQDGYGPPAKITLEVPVGCRRDAELPLCIESGRAKQSTYWQWKTNESVTLGLMAKERDVHLLIGYQSAAGARSFRNDGL